MAWSAENATKAYLRTLNLGNRGILEPGVAEFISALAAGTGARVMVEVCGDSGAGPTTLALIAAASQTGGHAVCILRGPEELHSSTRFLGPDHSRQVDLVLGDAEELLLREYRGADFVLVDCQVYGSERAFKAAQHGAAEAAGGGVVVGYNAMCGGSGDGFNDSSSGRRGV
uniref:Uncharacterized protein n=1 Tax=Ananas comosus var. bracteatus TaxID=296719 RepID=A0A6V7PXQ6_ANACO|nr:unnamed protein product [Ananas comosus var. bracteatus]